MDSPLAFLYTSFKVTINNVVFCKSCKELTALENIVHGFNILFSNYGQLISIVNIRNIIPVL